MTASNKSLSHCCIRHGHAQNVPQGVPRRERASRTSPAAWVTSASRRHNESRYPTLPMPVPPSPPHGQAMRATPLVCFLSSPHTPSRPEAKQMTSLAKMRVLPGHNLCASCSLEAGGLSRTTSRPGEGTREAKVPDQTKPDHPSSVVRIGGAHHAVSWRTVHHKRLPVRTAAHDCSRYSFNGGCINIILDMWHAEPVPEMKNECPHDVRTLTIIIVTT